MSYSVYISKLRNAERTAFEVLSDRLGILYECPKILDISNEDTGNIIRAYSYLGATVILAWDSPDSIGITVNSGENGKNARICNGLEKLATRGHPETKVFRSKVTERLAYQHRPLSKP